MSYQRRPGPPSKDDDNALWCENEENVGGTLIDWDEKADGEGTLLGDLAIGQSIAVFWEHDGAACVVEDLVRCQVCGQVLSEVRLALIDREYIRCPLCGSPPEA